MSIGPESLVEDFDPLGNRPASLASFALAAVGSFAVRSAVAAPRTGVAVYDVVVPPLDRGGPAEDPDGQLSFRPRKCNPAPRRSRCVSGDGHLG